MLCIMFTMCEWSYDDVVHTECGECPYLRRRYLVSCVDAYYNHIMCTCVYCGSILYICMVHVEETLTYRNQITAKLQ